jgi:hypothetical protein
MDAQIHLAETARDLAIMRAEYAASDDWKSEAMCVIWAVAKSQPNLTTDDVWDLLAEAREPRAMGAMMKNAQREGWIRPLSTWALSRRPICHCRPVRMWQSLLWGV